MNEGINLLAPNNNSGSAVFLRRIQKMRVLTIGLLFIISVSSVILFILVALSPLPALQRQEQFLQQTLSASKSTIVKLSLVNSQTDAVNNLSTKRKSFDKPISLVQDKLSSDITVQQLQADSNSLVITVESTSLQSLDTFTNGLIGYVQAKNAFSKVTLVDLTTDLSANAYALTVQLNYL
jgi:hypothetical protein